MRNAEVIRQWRILKRIEAGRYTTAQDLADEHGVTERTIRRDIEALQEAGFPLYDERTDGRKVWRLIEGYKQRLTQTFTLAELSALFFSKNLMSFLGGAPFAQDVESAFEKIREALPERSLPYLARIQDLFSARPDPWKDYSEKQDVIAALIDAVLHQRQAQIAYFSFNSKRTKAYTIDPYRVVYYHGGLYLYARAHEYNEVRTFAVERIQKIEVLDHSFEIPSDFNVTRVRAGRVRDRGRASRRRWRSCSPPRWPDTSASACGTRARCWRTGPNGSVVLPHAGHAGVRAAVVDQGVPAPRARW